MGTIKVQRIRKILLPQPIEPVWWLRDEAYYCRSDAIREFLVFLFNILNHEGE